MDKKPKKRYELRTLVDRKMFKHISDQAEGKKLSITAYLRSKLHDLIEGGLI